MFKFNYIFYLKVTFIFIKEVLDIILFYIHIENQKNHSSMLKKGYKWIKLLIY